MSSPCRDCEYRCVGCHSNCDKYKEFKAGLEEVRKSKRLAQEAWPKYPKYSKNKKSTKMLKSSKTI